jgi:Ca2+-binding RTX toxin-like protein
MGHSSPPPVIPAGVWRKALPILAGALGAVTGIAVAEGGAAQGTIPCQGNPDATTITGTYTGSNGPDTVQGSGETDVIYGRGGRDTICAYLGKDRVYGGKGQDDLWGEARNDKLRGGSQADTLRGGNGANDVCRGGAPGADGGDDPDGAIDCETISGASPL